MVRTQESLPLRVLAQLNNRERTALIICVAFIIATLALSMVDQTSLIHVTRTMIDPNYLKLRYTGTIVMPDQSPGQCRFVQFDNKTSEIRHAELAECFSKPGVNSPYDRMNSFRDAFSRK
jgi:hypothetical protein